jgi:hypothetical protein
MKMTPERWVVLAITHNNQKIHKVFAGWYGGYLGSDSWKLNSGNVAEKEFDDRWEFTGVSGSVYVCYKAAYGMSVHMCSLLEHWSRKVPGKSLEIVPDYQPIKQPA